MAYKEPRDEMLLVSPDEIVVNREEWRELVDDQKFLDALLAAGVDNWSGYEYAQESLEDS